MHLNLWNIYNTTNYYGGYCREENGACSNVFYKTYFVVKVWVYEICNFLYGGIYSLDAHYQTNCKNL